VSSDITERKRVAGELLQAKEAAEAANRAKSDFLAVMSHEIRTPMNAVMGMTNLLLETPLNSKQQELASTVGRSGEMLLEIINDILDFSKIEAGDHFHLEEEIFSLHELVDGVVQLLSPRAEAKGIKLEAHWGADIPQALKSDAGRLRQVLVNLVSNGIKFTDHDGVKICIESHPANDQKARVRFTVIDSGIGIAPTSLPLLFKPFSQVDGSASRRRGGTGLGLAISKRIVDFMGGDIGVESKIDRGSKFWFEIEMELAELPAITAGVLSHSQTGNPVAAHPDSGASPADRPLRILVVEDNDINRRLAMFVLEKLGFRADFAGNGMEAVEAWERFGHDVIFMDCQMPEMDGFEATREIRKREAMRNDPDAKRVQVIALTANALKGDRERCLSAGMDGYISKPFTAQQIKSALNSCSPQIKVCATSIPVPCEPNAAVNFDPQPLVRLVSELGLSAVHEIVQDFANDLPGRVQLLQCPPKNGKFTMLARQAHSLRGVGITFGLVALAELLLAMETAAYEENLEEIKRLEASIKASSAISLAALQDWLRVDAD
jgi:CheY-like chemotaxis protein/nitrogen-specific signal transduction histidine kinase